MPAYSGRTPIIAMAAKNDKEDKTLEELDQLKARVAELEQTVASKDTALAEKDSKITTMEEELTSLRSYKETAETNKAEDEKFSAIKNKFVEAGIEKDDEYYNTNRTNLLSLSSEALDFMLQELVAFANAKVDIKPKAPKVPPVTPTETNLSIKDIAKALREIK